MTETDKRAKLSDPDVDSNGKEQNDSANVKSESEQVGNQGVDEDAEEEETADTEMKDSREDGADGAALAGMELEDQDGDEDDNGLSLKKLAKTHLKKRPSDQDQDDEDEKKQGEEEEDQGWWGSTKQEYYDADNIETEADALAEEAGRREPAVGRAGAGGPDAVHQQPARGQPRRLRPADGAADEGRGRLPGEAGSAAGSHAEAAAVRPVVAGRGPRVQGLAPEDAPDRPVPHPARLAAVPVDRLRIH